MCWPRYLLIAAANPQRNSDLAAAAACAPHELDIMVALRLGRGITAQLTAVHGGELDLRRQQMDDDCAARLAAALAANTTVTRVDLRDNCIGDAGAVALATHLGGNTTVSEIDLTGNATIGAAGAAALIALVTSNANMVGVEIDSNGEIDDDVQQRLATLCQVWRRFGGAGFLVGSMGGVDLVDFYCYVAWW
jgi:hypothetical protein